MKNEQFLIIPESVICAINSRLYHAITKHNHSEWAEKGKYWALGELEEEYQEVRKAVEKETDQRMKDELLDLICVAIRMYEEEYV